MRAGLPSADEVCEQIESGSGFVRVAFDTQALTAWDSGLLVFLRRTMDTCSRMGVAVAREGLPRGVERLLALAAAVPEKEGTAGAPEGGPLLARVGLATADAIASIPEMMRFIGEACVAFIRFLGGKARFRRRDLWLIVQECGAHALPIVTLISVLVGLILAFVGAVQLRQFGAQIYVADLVGLAMVREMAALMTAIILAGRTGAAFAAQLGTMTVNEEIDALETMGISPMEFLVLPRMLALSLMMPLLCVYADLMGILGGALVGVGMLDLSVTQYVVQTREAIGLNDFAVGIVKSAFFGVLVAIAGCLRGMQCGRSASAVGLATTSAVVTAIVLIITSDAVFAVITNVLGV